MKVKFYQLKEGKRFRWLNKEFVKVSECYAVLTQSVKIPAVNKVVVNALKNSGAKDTDFIYNSCHSDEIMITSDGGKTMVAYADMSRRPIVEFCPKIAIAPDVEVEIDPLAD